MDDCGTDKCTEFLSSYVTYRKRHYTEKSTPPLKDGVVIKPNVKFEINNFSTIDITKYIPGSI